MIKKLKLIPAHIVSINDNIINIAKYMKKYNARYVFVVDENKKPFGIISLYDIVFKGIASSKEKDIKKITAKTLMTTPVEYVDINDPPEMALKIMIDRHTYACLVTEKGKVKGLVDYKSVMEAVMKNMNKGV